MKMAGKARPAPDVPDQTPQDVVEAPPPRWPEPPRVWTEEELTHTDADGVWAPALKEHWDQAAPVEAPEEVIDNG